MQHDVGEIERELAEWEREAAEVAQRHWEEKWEVLRARHELLVRARDAGMTNTQIAEALSAAQADDDAAPFPFTTQSVTAMMRDAEAYVAGEASQAAHLFENPDLLEEGEDDR